MFGARHKFKIVEMIVSVISIFVMKDKSSRNRAMSFFPFNTIVQSVYPVMRFPAPSVALTGFSPLFHYCARVAKSPPAMIVRPAPLALFSFGFTPGNGALGVLGVVTK
jgi:hypothetical protein